MRLVAPLATCVASVWLISLQAPSDSFIDRALPLYAVAVAVVALLEALRFGDAKLAFALPLLGVIRIAVFDENLRILVYGVILAVAVITLTARVLARFGRLTTREGVALVVVCVAAMKLVPFSVELALPQAIVLFGVALLALSLATREGLGAGALIVCLAAGMVAPLVPTKGSLFPLLLAAVLCALRGPSPFSIAAVAVTAAIAGRWAWPLAGLVVCAMLLEEVIGSVQARRTVPAALAVVPFGALPLGTGALAAATFSPESIFALPRLAMRRRHAAVAVALAALVLRPSLGALYMIAALAILMTDEESASDPRVGMRRGVPLVAATFVFAMLSLAGFSGAVASRFPLPLPYVAVALVALPALLAWPARRLPAVTVVLSAVALVAAVAYSSVVRQGTAIEVNEVLAPGESWELAIEASDEIRVEIAGGNLTSQRAGAPLGVVEAFDANGRAIQRNIVIGDVADWGFGRPGHYFAAHNEWPWVSDAKVAEYGNEAFFGGSGSIIVTLPSATRVRVTAATSLPRDGRVKIDSITVAHR